MENKPVTPAAPALAPAVSEIRALLEPSRKNVAQQVNLNCAPSSVQWNKKRFLLPRVYCSWQIFVSRKPLARRVVHRKTFVDNRGGSMSRPYPHVSRNSAEVFSVELHGILKREKQLNDIRKISRVEVQVSQPRILVQRILRRYHREKCKENRRIQKAPARRR